MNAYRTSQGFRDKVNQENDWEDVVFPNNSASRLAIFDLASVRGNGTPKLVAPTNNFPLAGNQNLMRRLSRPIVTYNRTLRSAVEAYVKRFINNEMSAHTDLALLGAGSAPGYRAIVSFDYYASRALATSQAHKDTFGNTLFVMLHYDNPSKMEGPEYVIDKWPAPVTGNGLMPGMQFNTRLALNETRARAPWKLDNTGKPWWPRPMLQGLEFARDKLAQEHPNHVWNKSLIGKRGMVLFVDELIYHTTPLMYRRDDDPLNAGTLKYSEAALSDGSNTRINVVPGRTSNPVRRLSTDLRKWENEDAKTGFAKFFQIKSTRYDAKGGMDARRFNRIWISVVPDTWYREIR